MHQLKYEKEKEKLRKCFSTGAKKNEERSSLYIGIETLFKCLSWAMLDLKPFFFLLFFPFFFFKLSSTFSFILTYSHLELTVARTHMILQIYIWVGQRILSKRSNFSMSCPFKKNDREKGKKKSTIKNKRGWKISASNSIEL